MTEPTTMPMVAVHGGSTGLVAPVRPPDRVSTLRAVMRSLGGRGVERRAGLAVLMLFFFYTLNNLRMPIVTGFLSDRTEAQQRATVLSVLSQLRALMAAAIALLFGLIADNLGIPYVFLIGGVVLLAGGFFLRLQGAGAVTGPESEVA